MSHKSAIKENILKYQSRTTTDEQIIKHAVANNVPRGSVRIRNNFEVISHIYSIRKTDLEMYDRSVF